MGIVVLYFIEFELLKTCITHCNNLQLKLIYVFTEDNLQIEMLTMVLYDCQTVCKYCVEDFELIWWNIKHYNGIYWYVELVISILGLFADDEHRLTILTCLDPLTAQCLPHWLDSYPWPYENSSFFTLFVQILCAISMLQNIEITPASLFCLPERLNLKLDIKCTSANDDLPVNLVVINEISSLNQLVRSQHERLFSSEK